MYINTHTHAQATRGGGGGGRFYVAQEAFGLPHRYKRPQSQQQEEGEEEECIICLTEPKVRCLHLLEMKRQGVNSLTHNIATDDQTNNNNHTGRRPPPLPALLRLRALPPLPVPLPCVSRPVQQVSPL